MKGWLPDHTHTEAGLCLIIQHCLEWRKLPDSCFLQFVTLFSSLDPMSHSVLLCLSWEKKAFSGEIRLLLSGEHI